MDENKPQTANQTSGEFDLDAILNQISQKTVEAAVSADRQPEESAEPLSDQPKEPEKKKTKKKKKRKKKTGLQRFLSTFLWLFCIVTVSCALAFFGLFALSDYSGLAKDVFNGGNKISKQIIIQQGASAADVALQLENEGILLNRYIFLGYLKLSHKGGNINYGAHDFETDMSYNEILDSLAQPVKAEDVEVVIPACATIDEIAAILDEAEICSAPDFIREVVHGEFDSRLWAAIPQHEAMQYRMEGYLFPDTYHFYRNDSPHRVIQKMLDNLEEKFTDEMLADAQAKGYSTHEIMTMASVIQMEADGYFKDMPKVSAVFYNRLNDWPEGQRRLQSDPTMYYAYGDGAYNTYKIEGLPPGPMGSVTEQAIKAAVYPSKKVDAYFFVTDKNGKFYYNDNEAGHNATISELKQQDLWLETPFID